MTMTGDDVRTARELLGMKRQQLADALGLTIAQVARIETKGPKPEEVEHLEEYLTRAGVTVADAPESSSDVLTELPPPPAGEAGVDDFDTGQAVAETWRTIKRGQVIRVDGEVGKRFRFGHHFKSATQEYVEVYSLKNGGARCIRPERIRLANGRVPPA